MRTPRVRLTHLAGALAAVWVGRWALLEVAARVAGRIPPPPQGLAPGRAPGQMPGPFDG